MLVILDGGVEIKALLKQGEFRVGAGERFSITLGAQVEIIETETHPIWGIRYKISGYKEWFEASCFKWIEQKDGEK